MGAVGDTSLQSAHAILQSLLKVSNPIGDFLEEVVLCCVAPEVQSEIIRERYFLPLKAFLWESQYQSRPLLLDMDVSSEIQ